MRTNTLAGLAIMIALSSSACSPVGGSDEPSNPPATSAPASAPANDPTPAPTGSASSAPTPADPSQSGGTNQLGQPVTTRESSDQGRTFKLTLYPVVRSGTTSTLNLTLNNPGEDVYAVGNILSDNNLEAGDETSVATDGIRLIDGKNAKLYLVASDGAGHCVCTRGLSTATLKGGDTIILSATFAAPPPDVTTVDVVLSGFGTVRDVPVQ